MSETRSVVVRLSMEASNYIANAQKAGKVGEDAMHRVERSAMSADQATEKVGNTAGKAALGGFAALLATGKAAMDWESQWAGVTKTVDGTTTQMAELEDGLRDLATSLPATHEEIAGVAEAAGQLGVAREDIIDFTRTMVDLGETTNLTAEQAATGIAQISNVMGTAGDEVDNFGAALVALGNDGASTEAQILDMTQRIAGAGAQIGLAESDILAIANAAASMGIEAEAGGSAISRVFTELAKATAGGGDKLEQFAQVAGMSAGDFATAFENDPARAFASFTGGLDRINKSGGDVFTTLDQLKLSDVRVSQALLGMAASGDLLTDSLDLGARAWDENTALALEAAKRYDTTASQVQVSWNQIKDAGIEAGQALLPVVSGMADKVGVLADAFGALPDPAKDTFTRLLAIGTLTAGAAWLGAKTIGAITSTREALSSLDTTGSKTERTVGKLGRAANVAAGGLAALAIVDALQGGLNDTSIGVEEMTRDLLDLDAAAAGGDLPKNLDGLASSIERLADPNAAQALQDNIAGVIGFGGGSELAEASSQIDAIDLALSNLVNTAGPEAAAEALAELASGADLSKSELSDLESLLPGYQDAMAGVENETKLAADAQEELDDGARTAANGITYSAEQIEAATKSYEEAVDAARDTAQAFFGVGESVSDADVSLSDWTQSLNAQAAALEGFTRNSLRAAKRGLDDGLIASLQAAGPEGALRMKQLANGTKAELEEANKAWRRGERAIEKYVDATTEVPDELATDVKADAGPAFATFKAVDVWLDQLDGTHATTYVDTVRTVTGPKGAAAFSQKADGGVLDFFADGGMRENHVAQIAPAGDWRVWAEPETGGEAYIPLAPSKRERSIDIWEEVGARLGVQFARYAGGGTDGKGKKPPVFHGGFTVVDNSESDAERERRERREAEEEQRERDRQADWEAQSRAEQEANDYRNAMAEAVIEGQEQAAQQLIDAAETQKTAAESVRDQWEQAMDRVGAAATAAFKTDLFGGTQQHGLWTGDGGGTGSAWRDALANDIKGLEDREGIIAQLTQAGVTGGALEALLGQGSNADITALLQSGELGDFVSMYNRRDALTGSVANAAGQGAYGTEYAAAAAAVAGFEAQIQTLQQQLATISAQRPITILQTTTEAAAAAELARLLGNY